MSLEHALYALLYRRRAREALLSNDAERLGVSSKELAVLATVNRDQLERAARLVTEGVLSRAYHGEGTLLEAFPRTIEAWRRANPRRTLRGSRGRLRRIAAFRGLPRGSHDRRRHVARGGVLPFLRAGGDRRPRHAQGRVRSRRDPRARGDARPGVSLA